jgi:hypothetical protein
VDYLVLIYTDESVFIDLPKEDKEKVYQQYNAYSSALREAGIMRGGSEVQPSTAAITVAVRDGDRLVTDGSFAESREQLCGYYLIECAELDEALAWAARCPGATYGSVEVRPLAN